MGNSHLHTAKVNKNDEFYTRYEDIEKEVIHYKDELKGKYIYCNCDDYRISNFVKYFKDNFKELGLRKLVATNYSIDADDSWYYELTEDGEKIEKLKGNGSFDSMECRKFLEECDIVITNPPFSKLNDFFMILDEY